MTSCMHVGPSCTVMDDLGIGASGCIGSPSVIALCVCTSERVHSPREPMVQRHCRPMLTRMRASAHTLGLGDVDGLDSRNQHQPAADVVLALANVDSDARQGMAAEQVPSKVCCFTTDLRAIAPVELQHCSHVLWCPHCCCHVRDISCLHAYYSIAVYHQACSQIASNLFVQYKYMLPLRI
jgi:hypothetical protein